MLLHSLLSFLTERGQATAFDVRYDGHSVLNCEATDEDMARELGEAAKDQDLDVWSHSVKAVSFEMSALRPHQSPHHHGQSNS